MPIEETDVFTVHAMANRIDCYAVPMKEIVRLLPKIGVDQSHSPSGKSAKVNEAISIQIAKH